jgi:uncharacterized membrane protein
VQGALLDDKEDGMAKTIGNPLSWMVQAAAGASQHAGANAAAMRGEAGALPEVREITMGDIRAALKAGAEDFAALRSDVIFYCLLYPFIGLTLAWFTFNSNLLHLAFPLVSGFALLGPIAAVGIYELSRRREKGLDAGWGHAFSFLTSPSFGAIFVLGVYLLAVFVAWLVAAHWIWRLTLGPVPPASLGGFATDVLTTPAGWAMVILGVGVGFVFAAMVLAMSLVSFPLLIDRNVGVPVAVATSIAVARRNPRTVAAWGLLVAVMLALGAIPALLGLAIVLPLLGHATWHLYRRAVV